MKETRMATAEDKATLRKSVQYFEELKKLRAELRAEELKASPETEKEVG